jgi:hypothetical protein
VLGQAHRDVFAGVEEMGGYLHWARKRTNTEVRKMKQVRVLSISRFLPDVSKS